MSHNLLCHSPIDGQLGNLRVLLPQTRRERVLSSPVPLEQKSVISVSSTSFIEAEQWLNLSYPI